MNNNLSENKTNTHQCPVLGMNNKCLKNLCEISHARKGQVYVEVTFIEKISSSCEELVYDFQFSIYTYVEF
jgi:hypothetical protein